MNDEAKYGGPFCGNQKCSCATPWEICDDFYESDGGWCHYCGWNQPAHAPARLILLEAAVAACLARVDACHGHGSTFTLLNAIEELRAATREVDA